MSAKDEARTAEILRLRFEEEQTLQQIANRYGLTRERVRQIIVAAVGGTKFAGPSKVEMRRLFRAVVIAAKIAHNQRHGTCYRYRLGCHCFACRRANTDYYVERARSAHPEWTKKKRYRYTEVADRKESDERLR